MMSDKSQENNGKTRKIANLPLAYVGLSNHSRKLKEQNNSLIKSTKGKLHIFPQ